MAFKVVKELDLVNNFGISHKVAEGQELILTERGSVVLLKSPVFFAKFGKVAMSVQIGKCELDKHLESGDLIKTDEKETQ